MRFRRLAFAALITTSPCLVTAACSTSTDSTGFDLTRQEGDGEVGSWVHSGFFNRTYYLHTPPGMGTTGSYPVLILLHGAGDTGKSFHSRIDADAATDASGFVTVFPDGLEGTWTVGCGGCTPAEQIGANDVQFLHTLVRQLAGSLPVDTTRVYVAGFSQGGELAQVYACTSDIPPAGIAVVSGSPYQAMASRCTPAAPLPVVLVHGTYDPVIPIAGSATGGLLSVDAMVDLWSGLMACDSVPAQQEHGDSVGDGTTWTSFRFTGCAGGASVLYDRVNGGGHTWPGDTGPWPDFTGKHSRNLDATRAMLGLFAEAAGGGS